MLRVGVAGLGFGAAVHAPVLASLPGVKVCAIAGSSRARAASAAERLGIERACGGIEELLEQELDAVSLALPPGPNEQALAGAVARRLPILSEKPISASALAARQLASSAANLVTLVDFQFMELSLFQQLRELLITQRYGQTRSAQVTWQVESYAQRNRLWGWKTDASRGGGVMAMLGSHLLFLAEWLLGPIETVQARFDSVATAAFAPPGAQPAEDRVSMEITFASGVHLDVSLANSGVEQPLHEWLFECERGTLRLANPTADYMSGFSLEMNGSALGIDQSPPGRGREFAFRSLATRFVKAVGDRAPCAPDLMVGARVQDLLEQVRAAAAS